MRAMDTVKKWADLLRHERELRGWSQEEIAKAVGTDQKVVSRWERGISRPSPYFRKQLVELFDKDARELGFLDEKSLHKNKRQVKNPEKQNDQEPSSLPAANHLKEELPEIISTVPESTYSTALPSAPIQPIQLLIPGGAPVYVTIQVQQQPQQHIGMADINLIQSMHKLNQNTWIPPELNGVDRLRRKILEQFLRVAGASIVASQELFNDDAWERLKWILNKPHAIDEAALTHLERLTDSYWEMYRSTIAKVDQLSSVLGHLQTATRLLEHSQPVSTQRRLCSIVSNTAQIIGEIYFDMNKCQAAMDYYDLAIETAQEAGNDSLASLAFGRKGFLPIYAGYSEESLPFLQHAYTLAQQTTTGKSKSWLVTMQAEAFSNLRKKHDCLKALEEAERVIDFADGGEDAYWTGFERPALAGYKGICYMRLHMPEEARKVLQQSLQSFAPSPTRRKSIVLSDLAMTYVQQGEVEEACRIASDSLMVAVQSKSARAIQRLRELQNCLSPWNDQIAVKRFQEQLAPFGAI